MPISRRLLIADSSPLIALAKLSLLDLPTRLFGRVVMPEMVYRECTHRTELLDAQAIESAVANGFINVLADVAWPTAAFKPRLNDGELSAIAMALELHASVLIDESRARRVARGKTSRLD